MSRHFDKAEGLYEEKDAATQGFVFNQTMLRIAEYVNLVSLCVGRNYAPDSQR